MLKSFRARWLWFFLVLLGCSARVGEGDGSRSEGSGSAGEVNASGGRSGGSAISGAPEKGGATGSSGQGGLGAAVGDSSAGVGATANGSGGLATGGASAGNAGSAGASSGLTGGSGSNLGSSGSGGVNGRGPAPTFTMIYSAIITPTCGGGQCHLKRPTPFGYDFSSKSAASAAWRADVFPGDAEGSPMFQVLNFGIMPKDRSALSIEQLFMVYDWINAGALDN